jgi:hypothetical protein
MRDNDILDDFWGKPEEKPLAPKKWERNGCRELDEVFGIKPVHKPVVKPAPIRAVPVPSRSTPVRKPVAAAPAPKRRGRKGGKRVSPGEAIDALAAWEKKLLKARKMVQKYRQAVKRYQKQGRI